MAQEALLQRQQADLFGQAQRGQRLPNDLGRRRALLQVVVLHVHQDADLLAAIAEREGIARIGHQQGAEGSQIDHQEDGQAAPDAPGKATLEQQAIEQIERHSQHHQPRGQVGVVAQSQEEAAQREVAGAPVARGPQEKIERQDHEQQRRDLVPSPAAHGDVPAADGQQEGGNESGGDAKQQPGQRIERGHGQDGRQQRSGLQRGKADPHHLEQPHQIERVHGGGLEPARGKGAVGPSFQDAQRIQRGVGLVHEDARRHLLQAVDAQEGGQGQQRGHAQQLQPKTATTARAGLCGRRVGGRPQGSH
jgi:hypothetical protein